jgi:hypothetical protein
MNTTLEEELGAAFAARVADLPPEATARVRAIDYRPRQHRRTLRVGLGAGAAAGAATAGTVLAVVLGGAAPAFAGWSATPTAVTTSAPAAPDCLSTLANTPAGSSGTGSGAGTDTGAWQTLLSDVRGPFTITLLQDGTSYASCFTGPSFTEVNRITAPAAGAGGAQSGELTVTGQAANAGAPTPQGGVGSVVRLEETSSGDLTQVLQNHLTTSTDGPYTFIDGRVANGVTGVTVVLDDGQDVVTTVAAGWFVAWWPGSTADATSAQVTKATATTSELFVPVSQSGVKFPFGQSGPASGVPFPSSPGSCTTATTAPGTSGGPGVDCKSSGSSSTANSGNSGPSSNTGMTGPGPTTGAKS